MSSAFNLTVLQTELQPWVTKNFGNRPAWEPLLGIVEEVGELYEALASHQILHTKLANRLANAEQLSNAEHDVSDALADAVVFMADFANVMNFDLESIVNCIRPAPTIDLKSRIIVLEGKLAHAYLKKSQGIRGTAAEHDEAMKGILCDLYVALRDMARLYLNADLINLVETVWGKVKQRDYTKNRITGGEA